VSVFLDTSALFAVLDADDPYHARARELWEGLINRDEDLVCTNYVLVENCALVQRRLGMEAVRTLEEDILPLIRVHWVGESGHRSGLAAFLTAGRRELSLVDCVSFMVMRQLDLRVAFAFDQDFQARGFDTFLGESLGIALCPSGYPSSSLFELLPRIPSLRPQVMPLPVI